MKQNIPSVVLCENKMPVSVVVDLSTVESERAIDQYMEHLERISEENSTLCIRNELDSELDFPRVTRIIQAALRNEFVVSFEFDSITIPMDDFCDIIESNQLISLQLLSCQVGVELDDDENENDAANSTLRITDAFSSNKFLQKLVLEDCSGARRYCSPTRTF